MQDVGFAENVALPPNNWVCGEEASYTEVPVRLWDVAVSKVSER